MQPAVDLFGSKKQPKPAKAPPTRDDAAESARRAAEQEEKKRALLARGATGTVFAGGNGLQVADSSAPKKLTGQ